MTTQLTVSAYSHTINIDEKTYYFSSENSIFSWNFETNKLQSFHISKSLLPFSILYDGHPRTLLILHHPSERYSHDFYARLSQLYRYHLSSGQMEPLMTFPEDYNGLSFKNFVYEPTEKFVYVVLNGDHFQKLFVVSCETTSNCEIHRQQRLSWRDKVFAFLQVGQ
jgi:hypothetical protein